MDKEKLQLLASLADAMESVWKDIQRGLSPKHLDECASLIERLTPLLQDADARVALAALAYHIDGGIRETFLSTARPDPPDPECPEAA